MRDFWFAATLADRGSLAPPIEDRKEDEMSRWMSDVVATVRALRRAPGFSLTALVMLSVAMAANSVMFSVINAVARPELPYRDAARILSISEAFQPYGWTDVPTSLATYETCGSHPCTATSRSTRRGACRTPTDRPRRRGCRPRSSRRTCGARSAWRRPSAAISPPRTIGRVERSRF